MAVVADPPWATGTWAETVWAADVWGVPPFVDVPLDLGVTQAVSLAPRRSAEALTPVRRAVPINPRRTVRSL